MRLHAHRGDAAHRQAHHPDLQLLRPRQRRDHRQPQRPRPRHARPDRLQCEHLPLRGHLHARRRPHTGADHFTFKANDGLADSQTYGFDLTVTPNHAPQCQRNGTRHAKVGQQVTVFFFCNDEDDNDQDLSYTIVAGSGPNHGSLGSLANFQVGYTPTAGFTGEDGFTIRASDGDLDDDYRQLLHVANTPLCSTPPAVQVRSGRSRQVNVDCTVPDDEFGPVQYEVGTLPAKGTLSPPGTTQFPSRTCTAGPSAEGADSYTVRLTSTSGTSPFVTQAITTGAAVNTPPDCSGTFGQTVYSDRPAQLFMFCSDADNDTISFSPDGQPAHGSSSASQGQITYTANAGYVGPDSVPFTASDGHGGTAHSSWPVDVHPPAAPTCSPATINASVRPGKQLQLQLFCSNPQGDPQTYSAPTPPSKGALGSFDQFGGVNYTPTAGQTGEDTFTLRASNVVGHSALVNVTVTIDPNFNRAPQCFGFGQKRVATGVPSAASVASICSDPDGDPMQFVRQSQPAHGSVDAGPADDLTYTSTSGYLGSDSFTFIARDDRGAESTVATRFLDVVTSVVPTCTAGPTISLRPGKSRSVTLNCSDPNFNPITYKIVSGPAGG